MILKAKPFQIEAEKPIVILNATDAGELGVRPLDRVHIKYKRKRITAIVNVSDRIIQRGDIGLYKEIVEEFDVIKNEDIAIEPSSHPESLIFIKKKLDGLTLQNNEIETIIEDTVKNRLSDSELTAFVTALYMHGISMNEAAYLSRAMSKTGKTLKVGKKPVYDKHSIGGVPGDKTSILVVPIVAAAGLTIPKTSSRAITSPAGTADRFECIAPVELGLEEIRKVVKKANGCLVWGGAVDLAPADDIFINIEYPLSIDPFLFPSVMSKKKAVNAKYVVIDMPTGKGTKVRNKEEFERLAEKFVLLGKKLGIKITAISTFADQPLGHGIGPALEAREALETLMNGKGPKDLIDKASTLDGVLLEYSGVSNGKEKALEIIRKGKAYEKLKQIIELQGGNPNIKPEDIPTGKIKEVFKSSKSGKVLSINNYVLATIAKEAGAPVDKGAGIYLHKKLQDKVKKGETIFEIHAEKSYKMERAIRAIRETDIMKIGKSFEMKLEKYPSPDIEERSFILER